jgi:hypothetical protein
LIIKAIESIPDIKMIAPLVYAPKSSAYHQIGGFVTKAFEIGMKV